MGRTEVVDGYRVSLLLRGSHVRLAMKNRKRRLSRMLRATLDVLLKDGVGGRMLEEVDDDAMRRLLTARLEGKPCVK